MQCPVCDHNSDQALLRCGSCESTFERAALLELAHLAYLRNWLPQHIHDTVERRRYEEQIGARETALRLQMGVPAEKRRHLLGAVSQERLADSLALLQSLAGALPDWRRRQLLSGDLADRFANALTIDIEATGDRLGDPEAAKQGPVTSDAVDLALTRLPDWRAAHEWPASTSRALQRFLTEEARQATPSSRSAARPPAEIAQELAFLQAARIHVAAWEENNLIWPKLAESLFQLLDEQIAPLQEQAGTARYAPTDIAVIEFLLASLGDWQRVLLISDSEIFEVRQRLTADRAARWQATEAVPLPDTVEPAAAPVAAAKSPRRERKPLPRPRLPQISWRSLRSRLAEAAASGALMSGFLYVNAFAIVVAAAVLVTRFPDRFPLAAQIAFIAAVPTVFYLFGWIIRARIRLVQSGSILTNIGALLVAVDLAGIYSFGGLAGRVDAQLYWLLSSLFCALLYAVTGWRLRSEFTGYATLLALTSALVAASALPDGLSGWSAAAAALAAALMPPPGARLQRNESAFSALGRAAQRLPLLLLPLAQMAVFGLSRGAWAPAVTCLLATAGYAQLTRVYATQRRGGAILAHATVWSSVAALLLSFSAAAPPGQWLPLLLAIAAPCYLAVERLLGARMDDALPGRRARLLAPLLAGGGLLLAAIAVGIVQLDPGGPADLAFWTASTALLVAGAVLVGSSRPYGRPWLLFGGAALLVAPISSLVNVLLLTTNPDAAAWIGVTWVVIALVYLAIALRLRREAPDGFQLHLLAQLLIPGAGAWLGLAIFAHAATWSAWPVLTGLLLMVLFYTAAAVAVAAGRHEGLNQLAQAISGAQPTTFHWPIYLLLPLALAVAWRGAALPFPWLGTALAALALGYVPAGQWLRRRDASYRLPAHLFAYLLPPAGVLLALNDTWPLIGTLLLSVCILAALAAVYGRIAETAAAGLLLIWPFHLLLRELPLLGHGYALAYTLLGVLGYRPLALLLAPAGQRPPWRLDRQPTPHGTLTRQGWTLFGLSSALTGTAVLASVAAWLGGMAGFTPWVGVAVPLLAVGTLIFDTYHFRRSRYAILSTLLAAVAFGQLLRLLQVPAAYQPLAWIAAGGGAMLVERGLHARADGWLLLLRRPRGAAALLSILLGLVLLTPGALTVFGGGQADTLPLLLGFALATALSMLAARLYRSRLPLFVEPLLALVTMTVAFAGYAPRLLDVTVDPIHFPLAWIALAAGHLVAAALIDNQPVRYGHGLYVGAYGLALTALLVALFDEPVFTWTLGVCLLIAAASGALVHTGRHASWRDFLALLFRARQGALRLATGDAFQWFLAWLLPLWTLLFLRQLGVEDGFFWLGLVGPPVVYLAIAYRLRRLQASYAWPWDSAAQSYVALGLLLSLPLTLRFLTGGARLPAENAAGTAWLALQGVAVLFYALAALRFQRRRFSYLAAWLLFVPYTLGWIIYAPALRPLRLAWPWAGLALGLLAVAYVLDNRPLSRAVRHAHGPYLAGYALLLCAIFWAAGDRLTTVISLGSGVAVAALSQALAHFGKLRAFDDWLDFVWRRPGTVPRRLAETTFLSAAALGLPIWLVVTLAHLNVEWAGRGTALALCAPLYVALGLRLRHARSAYTWPLYSVGYLLTAIGALVAIDDQRLFIAVLTLNAVVYAASAYIFRQATWLYLAGDLAPLIGLLTLDVNGRLDNAWTTGLFLGLAVVYLAGGRLLARLTQPTTGLSPYALPLYTLGYLLSALGLAAGSSERSLAIIAYLVGVVFYAFSAGLFRETLFLYPAAWLAAVPYYLALTLTPLAPAWVGVALLPLIVSYVAAGRFLFSEKAPSAGPWRLAPWLARASTPFYLLAYGASVAMVLLARTDAVALTAALSAATILYVGSAVLFGRAAWLTPALLAGHLAVAAWLSIAPSGSPPRMISIPFMVVTWVVTLLALLLNRRLPAASPVSAGPWRFSLRGWRWQLGPWPFLSRLRTRAWAQPLWFFVAVDLLLWLAVAARGADTGLIVSLGFLLLLALLATLWQDEALAFCAAALGALALVFALQRAGLSAAPMFAALSGAGLLLFWLGRLLGAARDYAPPLDVWPPPLSVFSVGLTTAAALLVLPRVTADTLAVAAALGFAGLLYLGVAYRGRYFALGYGAAALVEVAWVLLLLDRALTQPQLYALPAGLYFLALGFFERRRGRSGFANYLEGFGAAVILLTTFIQSLQLDGGRPYFVLMIPEALLILGWGALRRTRVTFVGGMVGFAANVVGQLVVLSIVDDILRWIIIFGAAVAATALVVALQWQWQRDFADVKAWRDFMGRWS